MNCRYCGVEIKRAPDMDNFLTDWRKDWPTLEIDAKEAWVDVTYSYLDALMCDDSALWHIPMHVSDEEMIERLRQIETSLR